MDYDNLLIRGLEKDEKDNPEKEGTVFSIYQL
jgi:hypothetical protein